MQVCHDVTEDVERDVCMLMTRDDCRQVRFFSLHSIKFQEFIRAPMQCYESYWWLHRSNEWWKCGFMSFWWTTLTNQVPTKVCNQEEVPLCTKQEVAETKKVDHYNDIQLKKFQWSTTQVCKNVPTEVCQDIGEKCTPAACDYSVRHIIIYYWKLKLKFKTLTTKQNIFNGSPQVPPVCEDVCLPQFMCKICNQV